jgi:hypothetical protein
VLCSRAPRRTCRFSRPPPLPEAQGTAAREWLGARDRSAACDVLSCGVHAVPAAIADIAYRNKTVIYEPPFNAWVGTLITIAADRKLGTTSESPQFSAPGLSS